VYPPKHIKVWLVSSYRYSRYNVHYFLPSLVAYVYQTITTTLKVFPTIMTRFMVSLFTVTWEEINKLKDQYIEEFIKGDVDPRQTDSDGLPYSLDLLMLEEMDFLQSCLRSKSVKEEYIKALQSSSEPLDRMIFTCICLSQITSEEEATWDVDNNAFLAEETDVSSNYTCRTSSGDMIMVILP